MLTVRDLAFYKDIRTGGAEVAGDITLVAAGRRRFFQPAADRGRHRRVRPAFLGRRSLWQTASLAAGGTAWWFEEPGLVHGYLRGRHSVGRARASFTRIVEAVEALGKGDWPY